MSKEFVNNQKIIPHNTVGDGNCLFHSIFGSYGDVYGQYKTEDAQAMREWWHEFFNQCGSLDDPKMPPVLWYTLSLLSANTGNTYSEYLDLIQKRSHCVHTDEASILTSLMGIKIDIFYEINEDKTSLLSYKPNKQTIKGGYKRSKVWDDKKRSAIHLIGNHHSRAEVIHEPARAGLKIVLPNLKVSEITQATLIAFGVSLLHCLSTLYHLLLHSLKIFIFIHNGDLVILTYSIEHMR